MSLTRLIFVLGMHRSGTSAFCGLLESSGVSFGSNLLTPLESVNELGFWEDERVVSINERLLEQVGTSWFQINDVLDEVDWKSDQFNLLRSEAKSLLHAGFGEAQLQAVKDPRLCLTLPFWQNLCDVLELPTSVCVVTRSPLEVALSLEQRDDFPLGYGLRLYAFYKKHLERNTSDSAMVIQYDALLESPKRLLAQLADRLSVTFSEPALGVVQKSLRHQIADGSSNLTKGDGIPGDLNALLEVIENAYPIGLTLSELAERLVSRGQRLSELGEDHRVALDTLNERDSELASLSRQHSNALATIEQRDADIESLSVEHTNALATIDERDEQIREFDRRLSQLGDEHTHAQQVVRERDAELARIHAQLDKIRSIPGVGIFVRQILKHAQS